MPQKPTHIFFDIGGVLLAFSDDKLIAYVSSLFAQKGVDAPVDQIREILFEDKASELYFEAARFADKEDDYLAHVVEQLTKAFGVGLTDEEIASIYTTHWVGSIEPNVEMAMQLAQGGEYRVGILSDQLRTSRTGAVERLSDLLTLIPSERVFISCDCGRRKDDGTVWFEEVNAQTQTKPEECLFIDDSASKLAFAQQAGWQTVACPRQGDVTCALKAYLAQF